MDELDGNGAAGLLQEIFGTDMTVTAVRCASCGAVAPIGEAVVYAGGPGTVIRCRSCTSVLVVITQIRGMSCVDMMGIAALPHARSFRCTTMRVSSTRELMSSLRNAWRR
jgi:ribosomal protein S27E